MLVWIESAPESYTPDLALDAHDVLSDRWNGWLRPIATADALGRFLEAWRSHDPNGVWGHATAVGETLIVTRPDADEPSDEFSQCGVDDYGRG